MEVQVPSLAHGIIAAAFAFIAAFVGLKGIKYVAGVATYLPLIPVVVLLVLLVQTCGGLGGFEAQKVIAPEAAAASATAETLSAASTVPVGLGTWMVVGVLCTYIVGFFATAGAAGADIASNGRNETDVHLGGLGGVVLPTILGGGAAILIVAGAYGGDMANVGGSLNPIDLMAGLIGPKAANIAMIALAISSFPGACFSSLIAANSFKTTMPKINPFVSVGIGALVAAILAVTGAVGEVIWVFEVIGASFGPVCGAMLADSLLSGGKWSGPRAGFNPAGWISWAVGFAAGAFNLVVSLLLKWDWAATAMPNLQDWQNYVPVPPVTAMVLGFVLYYVLALLGARTRTLEMPKTAA
jgi:cytosine permease